MDMLVLTSVFNGRLQWIDGNKFAIVPFPSQDACYANELMAVAGELIEFNDDLSQIHVVGYGPVFWYRVA